MTKERNMYADESIRSTIYNSTTMTPTAKDQFASTYGISELAYRCEFGSPLFRYYSNLGMSMYRYFIFILHGII